jgi:hypothetical protein
MEYNEERCTAHGEQIRDLEVQIYGNNGNAGLKLEVQRLRDWRELVERQTERREKKQDVIIATLIIQSVLLAASKLIPLLVK